MVVDWSTSPWPLRVASNSHSIILGSDMRSPKRKAEIESRSDILLRPGPRNWQGATSSVFYGSKQSQSQLQPKSEWQLGAMRLHFSTEGIAKDLLPPSIYYTSLGVICFIYKLKVKKKKDV